MNSGMPELGSKISLISKADIRYEGRLFTVDPQECTIALASVRSFGTEERETKYPVPAQNQVYDYILFRGSDIKDIRVVNTQPLNDPAIVQSELSVPPSIGGSANFPGQAFPHPVLGHIGGPGPLGPYPQSMGGPMGGMSGIGGNIAPGVGLAYDPRLGKQQSELGAPLQLEPLQAGPAPGEQEPHDLISGSRSSTPGLLSRKSPTMDAGVQCTQPKDDKKHPQNRAVQPPNRGDGRSSQNRDRRGDQEQRPQFRNYRDPQQQHRDQNNDYHDRNQRNQHQQNRGGWVNNRGMVRQRGRGRGGQNPNFQRAPGQQSGQNQQQPQQAAPGAQREKKTLKFEGDYDFEQANTEFEELRSKLAKAKLDADQAQTKVNGESTSEKKDDSGNETGVEINEPEEDDTGFYDKAKSFFDNISCEAVERSKGRSQRTDWRIERKLNSETFGVASARRGAYRGRGYYRGGMGGGNYRGGYRGNYRGNRGGYHQRNNSGIPNTTPANAQAQPTGK
ncbi:protein LSM14 homolog A isoform X3 [Thrips palmi]|uniref:Protein LSM14 homolog A isoform X3 n=1 Tax=Thrips palmi TaxID=161013 RepID=A0A6P9A1E0_THRPL|nr:protein LSM14 homolog A isoform X3 [Thrips palmi]